jgi:ATP-dependent DNA helicase RecQ
MRLPPPARERRGGRGERTAGQDAIGGAPSSGRGDPDLLAALKAWRLEQARHQGLPPYVVFHDRTLIAIAERRPMDPEDLEGITGIGRAKLARYGEAVLEVVRRHPAQA